MNSIKDILEKIDKEDNLDAGEKDYLIFHQDRLVKILDQIAREENREIKILELGCGFGFLLRGCFRLGFKNLYGADAFDLPVDSFLRTRYSVEYFHYEAGEGEAPFLENSFDLIIFSEVLEHFDFYPLPVFAEMFRILKPGGRLLITTPNLVRLNNRIKLLLGKSINWNIERNYKYGAHFREYTAAEIEFLAKQVGFGVVDKRYIHFEYPDVGRKINLINRWLGFFWRKTRSNLNIICKK